MWLKTQNPDTTTDPKMGKKSMPFPTYDDPAKRKKEKKQMKSV